MKDHQVQQQKAVAILDRIARVVTWYQGISPDFSDIALLTSANRKLACCLFDYSGEVGDLYKEAKGSEYLRRTAYERERLRLIGEGKSAAAADIEAKASVETSLFQEVAADADYRAAQMQLSAARDVLEAMRQHIASLKLEHRLEMAGQGSQQQ